MKKTVISLMACTLACLLLFSACKEIPKDIDGIGLEDTSALGGDNDTFGASLEDTGAYDGYFEEALSEIEVACISGTQGAYTFENNTLTFSGITEDSLYSISGKLKGNIIVDIGDEYKLDIELHGLSLVSDTTNPILIKSGDKISLTAKKNYKNYIYDTRAAIDTSDETLFSAAVHSECDLEICGKGALTVVSEYNNGIHTKDDLELKNLELFVACADNALKGNDSVEISECTTTLIAYLGDGIKTSNSNISDKGNQRGTVSILSGTHTIYAACDGIDASYDAVVDGENTVLNIYTDKYSNYSEEVTPPSNELENGQPNEPIEPPSELENMQMPTKKPKPEGKPRPNQHTPEDFGGMGGFGGMMGDGNSNKSDHSTKGIKAANEIRILGGEINIKSYDDSIHANNDAVLENGEAPKGNVTVSGGTLTLYSNDDGIHADGLLTVSGGTVSVVNSYEALEGNTVNIEGGDISAIASDDGINSTATSGSAVTISGGKIYVLAGGDGIDANSRTSYAGITFSGGQVVVISTSGGNSAIDTEKGYTYTGGAVLALMPSGGMTSEATHANNFSEIATSKSVSVSEGEYLVVNDNGKAILTLKMPTRMSGRAIYLGSTGATFSSESSSSLTLDKNGVCWE